MHVVVVGCGRVGSGLAVALLAGGHSVAVVDRRPAAFDRLPSTFGGQLVDGVGFDRDVLRAAGVERAGALTAVTNGDNSNIVTARVAREHFGVARVVARIYDPRRAAIFERLGVPTVATVAWTVDRVLRRILPEAPGVEWTDPTGGLVLLERPVPTRWAGRAVGHLEDALKVRVGCADPLGRRPRAGACQRAAGRGSPPPHRRRRRRRTYRRQPWTPTLPGTDVARTTRRHDHAGRHRRGRQGRRVHRGPARWRRPRGAGVGTGPGARRRPEPAAARPGVSWLRADACEVSALDEARLGDADVVAAVTGDDEDNVVITLLAKQEFGVPRCVARVNDPANEWMFTETLGRRHRRVDTAPAHRARHPGRLGRHPDPSAVARPRRTPASTRSPWRTHRRRWGTNPRARLPAGPRPSSQCFASNAWWCHEATPCCGPATTCSCSSPTSPRSRSAACSPAPDRRATEPWRSRGGGSASPPAPTTSSASACGVTTSTWPSSRSRRCRCVALVRIAGEVTRQRVVPRAGAPWLEVTISDGTGEVIAAFAGRRTVGGLDPGRGVVLEGVAHASAHHKVIFNPAYTLLGASTA